jgi:hypothetical protein
MKILLRLVAILALLIAGGWIAATSDSPSLVERFWRTADRQSCVERSGCWDYTRQGCVFAKSAHSDKLEPTPRQAAADACHPDGDGDRLAEETKHVACGEPAAPNRTVA